MALFDFFKPQWKHSNPAHRAAAILHLGTDQQDVLLSIALEDAEAANRLAAARRLTQSSDLRKLRDTSKDRTIRELAQKTLLETLVREILPTRVDAADLNKIKVVLDEIAADQRLLEELARQAADPTLRGLALDRLTHASACFNLALSESDDKIAVKAFARVTRENQIETLAQRAKSKEVKRLAREALRNLEKKKQPDEASINRQKLQLLLGVAEKALQSAIESPLHFAWNKTHEQVLDAELSLGQLMEKGLRPDAEALNRFRAQVADFHQRYQQHTQVTRQREVEQQQQLEAKQAKETLFAELENLTQTRSDDGDALLALRNQFQKLGHAGEFEEELTRRFRTLFERSEKERVAKLRERDEQERRRHDEEEHQKRISVLVESVESLLSSMEREGEKTHVKSSDSINSLAFEKVREWRKDFAKLPLGGSAFVGREELAQRFEKSAQKIEALLEVKREQNLHRMREWVLEMEPLIENVDFQAAEKRFRELVGAWRGLSPMPVGDEAESLIHRWRSATEKFRETQDWLRWSNLRTKQDICLKLEALVEGEDRKLMVTRFKELQEQWKTTGPVPWDASEALWDRYHQIVDKLFEKLREYFAELDEERESHLKTKEEICARIEAFVGQDDIEWREATEVVKEAQSAWKSIGAVPKDKTEALWNRFRNACQAFFDRRDRNLHDNLAKKQELAALVESLQDSKEWKTTTAQIKEAQEKWKATGPVPKTEAEALWNRFHAACEKFFSQKREYQEKLEAERPANLVKKQELCDLIEQLDSLPSDQERYQRIIEAQNAWKEIGPAPRELEDGLWERFRKPIDQYFQLRKARLADEHSKRAENGRLKEEICQEAESLTQSVEWKTTVEKIKSLQAKWRTLGPAPREIDKDLWNRFRAACDGFFDRLKQNAQKRDAEREGNLQRKVDLCFMVELLAGKAQNEEEEKARATWLVGKLARDPDFNPDTRSLDWQEATHQVKGLQQEWKKTGPVPRELSEPLWERFHRACDIFFEERRRALGLREEDPQVNLESKLALIEGAEKLGTDPGPHHLAEIKQMRLQWRRIGPVPRAQSDYVWKRFNSACDSATGGGEGFAEATEGEGHRVHATQES